MSSTDEQRTSTIATAGEVGRRVLGTLHSGLRLGGRALERVRPWVERGLSLSPGTRADRPAERSSEHPVAPATPEVTPADVAARVAPRPEVGSAAAEPRTPRSAPGDRLPPRRPGPAPEPVRPADS
ncbi:hypothetical protein BKA08_003320 [Nocardioides marinisabuli]|uniref:Uncharacterized protein n=1 Tax=Nocardioides marinisabuli TaxID=419476 RepID=A0A7Y9F3R6_9ACTN|nr:hypothetical protein [Nocardioides marinisabuli]NYD59082.1 hypothetical protein [Nocardioides marinisabuli]